MSNKLKCFRSLGSLKPQEQQTFHVLHKRNITHICSSHSHWGSVSESWVSIVWLRAQREPDDKPTGKKPHKLISRLSFIPCILNGSRVRGVCSDACRGR